MDQIRGVRTPHPHASVADPHDLVACVCWAWVMLILYADYCEDATIIHNDILI